MATEEEMGVGRLQAMDPRGEAGTFPPKFSESAQPHSHLILCFPVSRTVRQLISVLLSYSVLHSGRPRKLTHPPGSLTRWEQTLPEPRVLAPSRTAHRRECRPSSACWREPAAGT